jgi:hypothetical protein
LDSFNYRLVFMFIITIFTAIRMVEHAFRISSKQLFFIHHHALKLSWL